MIRNWWKLLTGILLLYVLLAGMLVPLKPGIEYVEPGRATAGETVRLDVVGYNTQFTKVEGRIRAWLKIMSLDEYGLAAREVTVESDRSLSILFEVPKYFPSQGARQTMALVLDDGLHGPIVAPTAVFVSECVYREPGAEWKSGAVTGLHDVADFRFPFRSILYESIRNTYYHVPMWFGMILLFFGSAWFSIRYMRNGKMEDDMRTSSLNTTGAVFGLLGILTGMFWSTYTWGEPWSWDVKQNTAAITLLIYLAFFILRASFEDPERKARVSAVYNIFACVMIIPLLFVIPRMGDSLHPGSGGNPAMGGEDLDNTMRMIFYPAVIAWTLLGVWISQVLYRVKVIRERLEY